MTPSHESDDNMVRFDLAPTLESIFKQLREINEKLTRNETKMSMLLGGNGTTGKIEQLEDDIEVLKSFRDEHKGFREKVEDLGNFKNRMIGAFGVLALLLGLIEAGLHLAVRH